MNAQQSGRPEQPAHQETECSQQSRSPSPLKSVNTILKKRKEGEGGRHPLKKKMRNTATGRGWGRLTPSWRHAHRGFSGPVENSHGIKQTQEVGNSNAVGRALEAKRIPHRRPDRARPRGPPSRGAQQGTECGVGGRARDPAPQVPSAAQEGGGLAASPAGKGLARGQRSRPTLNLERQGIVCASFQGDVPVPDPKQRTQGFGRNKVPYKSLRSSFCYNVTAGLDQRWRAGSVQACLLSLPCALEQGNQESSLIWKLRSLLPFCLSGPRYVR